MFHYGLERKDGRKGWKDVVEEPLDADDGDGGANVFLEASTTTRETVARGGLSGAGTLCRRRLRVSVGRGSGGHVRTGMRGETTPMVTLYVARGQTIDLE